MKKTLILALTAIAFLFGCSAEGTFSSAYTDEFGFPTPNWNKTDGGTAGSCTLAGTCYPNITQSQCSGVSGSFSTSACPTASGNLCYDSDGWGDCDGIGAYCSIGSEAECVAEGGTVMSRAMCSSNGYDILDLCM